MSNAVSILLNYPPLARRLITHERYAARESTLPARDRALLALRTAWLTRSNYLWAHRAAAARQAGPTDADLRRIAQGPDAAGWNPFDSTLLRVADELHVDSFVSDASWKTLSTRYDTNQIVDAIDTAGATTMHAGLFNSLALPIEPGLADRFPSGVSYAIAASRTNGAAIAPHRC